MVGKAFDINQDQLNLHLVHFIQTAKNQQLTNSSSNLDKLDEL